MWFGKLPGLFDVAHMGLLVLRSGDAGVTQAFLDRLTAGDLSKLYPGKAVYTQFLNEQGGILDDVLVYAMPTSEPLSAFQEMLVIANAANAERITQWLRHHAELLQCRGLQIDYLSNRYALLALQGPRFADVLARVGYNTDHLPPRFRGGKPDQGIPLWIREWATRGRWCRVNFWRYNQAVIVLGLLLDVGDRGRNPRAGGRDTFRLEAAYPLHGHDITEKDTPLEAGLGWSVSLNKPVDFIGKAALVQQKATGLMREFCCFTVMQRAIAREHDVILKDGNLSAM